MANRYNKPTVKKPRNHKQKVKLARKLRTVKEIQQGVPLFKSRAWIHRKIRIYVKHYNTQLLEHNRAMIKKEQKNATV